jgi:O-antigen/teichoic acid export membrane protein
MLKGPLARGSLFMILTTGATGGFGYFYWLIAARLVNAESVGYTAAAMSLATGISLVTNLGFGNYAVERLPSLEGTASWARLLARALWPAVLLTSLVGAVVQVLIADSLLHAHGSRLWIVLILTVAAAGLTFTSVLNFVFISARRADLGFVLGVSLGLGKLLSLALLIVADRSSMVLLAGWAASIVLSCGVGGLVLLPTMGHGRLMIPGLQRPSRSDLGRVLGHHMTSIGGMLTPYLLPLVVLYRLGPVQNAYFYITWMLGSIFFILSPSIAFALFAESSRDVGVLASETRHAFRLISAVLPVPILAAVLGGHLVLLLFGPGYAEQGYILLVILAVAAIPDAVSNVAITVLRVRGKLHWAAILNSAMGVMALGGAWLALPSMGISGAGFAWFGAQVVGSIAVAPLLLRMARRHAHDRRSTPDSARS